MEHFAQTVEDDAEENRATADGKVEGKIDIGSHESGGEDENTATH